MGEVPPNGGGGGSLAQNYPEVVDIDATFPRYSILRKGMTYNGK